ncbi:unnamed protein product, partial [Amoebophrya sp. A25]|eukprot:GSA25T00021524001.1
MPGGAAYGGYDTYIDQAGPPSASHITPARNPSHQMQVPGAARFPIQQAAHHFEGMQGGGATDIFQSAENQMSPWHSNFHAQGQEQLQESRYVTLNNAAAQGIHQVASTDYMMENFHTRRQTSHELFGYDNNFGVGQGSRDRNDSSSGVATGSWEHDPIHRSS